MVKKSIYFIVFSFFLVLSSFGVYLYAFGLNLSAEYIPKKLISKISNNSSLNLNYENSIFKVRLSQLSLLFEIDYLEIDVPNSPLVAEVETLKFSVKLAESFSQPYRIKFIGLDGLSIDGTQFDKTSSAQSIFSKSSFFDYIRKENLDLLFDLFNLQSEVYLKKVKFGKLSFSNFLIVKSNHGQDVNKKLLTGNFEGLGTEFRFRIDFSKDSIIPKQDTYNVKLDLSSANFDASQTELQWITLKKLNIDLKLRPNRVYSLAGTVDFTSKNKALIEISNISDLDKNSEFLNLRFDFNSESNDELIVLSNLRIDLKNSKIYTDGKITVGLNSSAIKVSTDVNEILLKTNTGLKSIVNLSALKSLDLSIESFKESQAIKLSNVTIQQNNNIIPVVGYAYLGINEKPSIEAKFNLKSISFSSLNAAFPNLISRNFNHLTGKEIDFKSKVEGSLVFIFHDGLVEKFDRALNFSDLEISHNGVLIVQGASAEMKFLSKKVTITFDHIITQDGYFKLKGRSKEDLDKLAEYSTLLRGTEIIFENSSMEENRVRLEANFYGNLSPIIPYLNMVPLFDMRVKNIIPKLRNALGEFEVYAEIITRSDSNPRLDTLNISGTIDSANIDNFFLDQELKLISTEFEYDQNYFVVKGTAGLTDSSFTFNFVQTSDDTQGKILNLQGVLRSELVSEYLNFYSDIDLLGSLPIEANIIFNEDNTKFQLMGDMKGVLISLNDLDHIKPKGERGSITVEGNISNIENFNISTNIFTPTIVVESDLLFESGFKLINVPKLKITNVIDANGIVTKGLDKFDVTVGGKLLNYHRIKSLMRKKFTEDRINFFLNLEELGLSDRHYLKEAVGEVTLDDRFFGSLNGSLNGYESLSIDFSKPQEGVTKFTATSNNAGNIFRALNAYNNAYGGKFNFSGLLKDNEGVVGELLATDVQVRDGPILAQLVSLASLNGLIDLLAGKGIVFQKIKGRVDSDRSRTIVQAGFAEGQSIGITLEGSFTKPFLNSVETRINASGVLSPFYNINSAVKKIPLVGTLLGSREGEGILGFKFQLEGTRKSPLVLINPFSILAPGKYRDAVSQ